jgi:O-antigen ligase
VRAGGATDYRWLLAAVAAGLLAGLLALLAQGGALLFALALGGLLLAVVLILGWPFSGVVILIVAALLTRLRFDVGPISVRPEHVAAAAVAIMGFVQLGLERRALRMPAAAWFALLWWGINLVSGVLFDPAPLMGLQNALRIFLMALTFILMVNLIPDRIWWRRAVAVFLIAGVVEAAYGILARAIYPFGVNLGVQVAWNFTEPIPYGTFEEGNLFGSHSASWAIILLMVIFAAERVHDSRKRQLLRMAGLGVLLLALLLSLSRAAWIMFLAGATLVVIFEYRNAWVQANRFILAMVALPLLIFGLLSITPYLPASLPFVNRLQSFLNLGFDATFSARLSDWSMALEDWAQRPLTGWGPGSFFAIHGVLRAHPAWISNLSVRLLQETGVIGLVAFGGFLATLLLPAIKTLRRGLDLMDRGILLGLIISYGVLLGLAYQSTDGIWLAASWVHAGLIAAGTRVLTQA